MRVFRGRPPNVEKLARAGKAPRLVHALEYEDPVTDRDGRFVDLGVPVRVRAAEALGQVDDPQAVEGLLRALADPEERVRVAAVRALGSAPAEGAIEALVGAAVGWTDEARAEGRMEAVGALEQMRDARVPRHAAAELLVRPDSLEEVDCQILDRLAHAGGDDALRGTIDDLIAHLREASAPDRASRLLVGLAPASVEPMIAALDDAVARDEVALALGQTRDVRAVDALCSLLLHDEDASARRAAAWALGEIRHPSAVETLLVASRDHDFATRTAAIDAFDALGNAAVALAVGALMRPAVTNGSKPAEDSVIASPPEPQREQVAPPAPRAATESLATRATPALRRLLGR